MHTPGLVPAVGALVGNDSANRARVRAHDYALGAQERPAALHAVEKVCRGDAGCHEVAVVTRDEVICVQHAIEIVTGGERLLALGIVFRPQLALDHAAERLHRAGGEDRKSVV